MEAFIFGGKKLHLHLSLLFNLFLHHGFLPDIFCQAVIIPLVKCKTGDLSDVNNYRAIAISTAVSKILEHILLDFLQAGEVADDYQFGFKKHHSTTLCTQVLKQTVKYYTTRGSHVFSCFIDFKKAFDTVDYWHLFTKLIDAGMPRTIVELLSYWYCNQTMCVKWQNGLSDAFYIKNGVRQGSLLSPFLFRFYVRDLIKMTVSSRIGCNIGGTFINLLAYADDMVILAPSWAALQKLLTIIQTAAAEINMSFNTKKTVVMVFNPTCKSKVIREDFPAFTLAGCNLTFVEHFRYLGHIIENNLDDNSDIKRELKCLYTRANILIRRFSSCSCSVAVKIALFRTYCICLYDAALWYKYSQQSILQLKTSYHKCIKMFFGFNKYSSVTNILFQLGLPSFDTIIHNYKSSFTSQASSSNNTLVKLCL